ncbi:lysosomal Pro-X carboxypeptidase-like [Lingula anatina]|uniref:Lysosomal Pro-X carboxypeptidase n=1 Tax=Lingula anatina TaxID=7574 RepID=A0A1S3I872_LINAN|nr:lysosomal Pro-X carboxypeptidase-like [Lingula anatina]|eukprot:XP_013394465.1 lysosomal Pro-X carboxypeptidase-like [Lingula anatina]
MALPIGKKMLLAVLTLCALVFDSANGIGFHRSNLYSRTKSILSPGTYRTLYIKTKVDHFSFTNDDTYMMRYLVADQFWDQKGGPIFFYTGNEGDITWFCNNTGFMWDIAPKFKAMLVFAEHRYYGTSMPYGAESYKDVQHLGYLTSEQALADYALLINHMKSTIPGAENSPVVAFGGSYGGMLAAWFRMKYPSVVVGALAASAPIWQFPGETPCEVFYQIISKDYAMSGPGCADTIRASWKAITNLGQTDAGRKTLSETFHLCKPLKTTADVNAMKAWLSETWGNLAMVDYPYQASFLEPLPAWPIKVVCSHLVNLTKSSDLHLLSGISTAVGVYYNYTGQAKCFNISQQGTADLGDQGWNFQACSEMVMPLCTDGVHDMFEPQPWDFNAFAKGCKKQFGVVPRPQWIKTQYGGKNITSASNIIFSNGRLDPWSGGGVTTSLSDSLIAIIIEEGAHHLDLRGSNPQDPQSVIKARRQEMGIIKKWVQG